MVTVRRKSLLYKSGLGFWCLNHVQGCAHRCRYPCYASLVAKRYGRSRDESDWRRPRLVENAVELVERELWRRRQLAGAYADRDAFYGEQGRIVRALCREHCIRGLIDA